MSSDFHPHKIPDGPPCRVCGTTTNRESHNICSRNCMTILAKDPFSYLEDEEIWLAIAKETDDSGWLDIEDFLQCDDCSLIYDLHAFHACPHCHEWIQVQQPFAQKRQKVETEIKWEIGDRCLSSFREAGIVPGFHGVPQWGETSGRSSDIRSLIAIEYGVSTEIVDDCCWVANAWKSSDRHYDMAWTCYSKLAYVENRKDIINFILSSHKKVTNSLLEEYWKNNQYLPKKR